MAGPPWLAGTLAAVMLLIAAYSAGRLIYARLRRRTAETDADALHAFMGTAMAGMLVPRLNVLPASVWAAMFAMAAAWFGWHAIRRHPGVSRCRHPVPHLIESAAMIYMLVSAAHFQPPTTGPGMAMPGMGAGPAAGFPALAAVLALFMIGYIIWTTDRLTTLARARTTTASSSLARDHAPDVTIALAPGPSRPAAVSTAPSGTAAGPSDPAGRPMLAPKLAACCKIAMSIAMSYMLILML